MPVNKSQAFLGGVCLDSQNSQPCHFLQTKDLRSVFNRLEVESPFFNLEGKKTVGNKLKTQLQCNLKNVGLKKKKNQRVWNLPSSQKV